MADPIDAFFERLVAGVPPDERHIHLFAGVRDIPYRIIAHIRNAAEGPAAILQHGGGSCTPKHFLLGRLFERLGIAVRYVTFPFSWDDPRANYPARLRVLSRNLPSEYHLALHASLGERWTLVDATWDTGLVDSGFPVNAHWDGHSDTLLAVMPLDAIEHRDAAERDAFVAERRGRWTKEEQERMTRFYDELNAWLTSLRSS